MVFQPAFGTTDQSRKLPGFTPGVTAPSVDVQHLPNHDSLFDRLANQLRFERLSSGVEISPCGDSVPGDLPAKSRASG